MAKAMRATFVSDLLYLVRQLKWRARDWWDQTRDEPRFVRLVTGLWLAVVAMFFVIELSFVCWTRGQGECLIVSSGPARAVYEVVYLRQWPNLKSSEEERR